MATPFPTDGPVLSSDPPVTGLFDRTKELTELLGLLRVNGRLAIWATRFSGLTTLLYAMRANLQKLGNSVVYVSPDSSIRTRESLFRHFSLTMEAHILCRTTSKELEIIDWDKPEAFRRLIHQYLDNDLDLHLVVMIDNCEVLPAPLFMMLLHEIREIFRLRSEDTSWQRMSFVVSGALSFANLRLLESKDMSPLEDWEPRQLLDLSLLEAAEYLNRAFSNLGRVIETAALHAILLHAGGDLRRLNVISKASLQKAGEGRIEQSCVSRAIQDLLLNYSSDPSLTHMLRSITNDHVCLELVSRLLDQAQNVTEVELRSDDLLSVHSRIVGASPQELSGAFLLTEHQGRRWWRIRNGFCRKLLVNHFTPRRMLRSYLQLGRRGVKSQIDKVTEELARVWASDFIDFDEEALNDIVEWFWVSSLSGDQVRAGYEALEHVLEKVFGLKEYVLYEPDRIRRELRPTEVPLFTGPLTRTEKVGIGLRPSALQTEGPLQPEKRAFNSGVRQYYLNGPVLKVAIPLKDWEGKPSRVLSLRAEQPMEGWETLFVRSSIMERTLSALWQRLSRYERDQYNGLSGALPLISLEFHTESHQYFSRQCARFPADLPARFLEFEQGIIINEIIRIMESPRSLLIVDLSHINDNVLFELGLAIGMNRPGLLVREKERELRLSPLEGLVYATYQLGRPLSQAFFDRLRNRWSTYLNRSEERDFNYILNQALPERIDLKGEPYLLVIDHDKYRDTREFRRSIGRVAKIAGLRPLYLWQGGAKDERVTPEVRLANITLLLGIYELAQGAQAVVARIEKIQDKDHYAVRFLATGIAMGLAKRRQRANLLMTARTRSKEGRDISLPGDFKGCEFIHFDSADVASFTAELLSDLRRIGEGAYQGK